MPEMEMLWRLADAALEAGEFVRAKAAHEQGARLGDPMCWHGLGYMFDVGQGVDVDKEQAMRCYKAAWRYKSGASANNIAILYKDRGKRKLMFLWFKCAAEHGEDGNYLDLARCHMDGVGTRKSQSDALRCLAAAISGPNVSEFEREQAQELLGRFQLRVI